MMANCEADASSDLDLLVDFEAGRSLVRSFRAPAGSRGAPGCAVDIIEAAALRPQDSQVLADAVAL